MKLSEMESLRRKIIIGYSFLVCFFILFVLGITYYYIKFVKTRNDLVIMSFVGIVILIIFIIFLRLIKKDYDLYCSSYKKVFVYKALEKKFDNLIYNPKSGMPKSVIWGTHMMDLGDYYLSNDLISGKYHNTNFMQADVRIKNEYYYTDSNGNVHSYQVDTFYGKWLVFEFNKKFKYNVQVREKSFKNAKVDSSYSAYGYHKVSMENEKFNRKFLVYTEMEHDAFYLLTPHMMERIQNISDIIDGDLLLCFVDNELHIGLNNNQDSFEASILKGSKTIDKQINKDIEIITSFIDELNLSNDLFRKEV